MSLHTASISFTSAFLFCSSASIAFVGSLYVFVPSSVRRLDRDNALQIKWRTFATGLVCIFYYILLHVLYHLDSRHDRTFSSVSDATKATVRVLGHTALLYLGPATQMMVTARELNSLGADTSSWDTFRRLYLSPLKESLATPGNARWLVLRNLIIAPFVEECLFRGCIVRVLSMTGWSWAKLCLVSPLFFGVAHAHHARNQLRLGLKPQVVFLRTIFQMTYTSIFGAYATYTYLATGSFLPAAFSHAFCNGMGLPNLEFTQLSSPLYQYRVLLWSSHVVGIALFANTFSVLLSCEHVNQR